MGRGMMVISLWYCWGVMEAQDNFWRYQSCCCVCCFSSSSWKYNNDSLVSVIPRSIHPLLVILGLWGGVKCFWLKDIIISIMRTEGSTKCSKIFFSFMEMIISFSKGSWHLPSKPKTTSNWCIDHGITGLNWSANWWICVVLSRGRYQERHQTQTTRMS